MSQPANAVNEQVGWYYLGIDWGGSAHEVRLTNPKGEKIVQQTVEHSVKGFEQIVAMCQKAQVQPSQCLVENVTESKEGRSGC